MPHTFATFAEIKHILNKNTINIMATLKEKIGYGFGDMASSMFWKIFSVYLPVFYASVFGLDLVLVGTLVLVTRIWDAVSDPMMGIIADRTNTKWGKYRPYLLWIAVPFAIAGILLFTTPNFDETGKNAWAFVTYILMMTVYTAINVPYGSMLGVMTDDTDEKTVFSSYRMFFAYAGSFIVLLLWEPLCNAIDGTNGKLTRNPDAWQSAMIVVGVICCILFILAFRMTRERIKPTIQKTSIKKDFKALLHNKPWWILSGGVIFFNFLVAIRYAVFPFYFAAEIAEDTQLSLFGLEFLFYTGLFFTVGEIANMVGVAIATPLTFKFGKKNTFIYSLMVIVVLCIAFYYIPTNNNSGLWMFMILQIIFGIFTGIASPLMWTMYADVADYAECKFKTSSTGLIFSSSSMAQKFGGAFGTSAVMWLLAAFGFNTFATDGTQIADNNKSIEVVFKDKFALNTENNVMKDTLLIIGDNNYKTYATTEQDAQKLKLNITSDLPNGDYTIEIPEGVITRKKDNACFTGEITFTSNENGEIIEHDAKTTTKQTSEAIKGLRYLISWIPALIAILSAIFIFFYPLTTKRMKEINSKLEETRR